jgi:hypothetical protein
MNDPILVAADLIRKKQIDSAINMLEGLVDSSLNKEDSGMKYLHLGLSYAKKDDVVRGDNCFRKAIEFGHPTGMAYEKLAISLTKQGLIAEAIRVCQELIDHPTIPMPRSYLAKDDFQKRKEKLDAMLARRSAHGSE